MDCRFRPSLSNGCIRTSPPQGSPLFHSTNVPRVDSWNSRHTKRLYTSTRTSFKTQQVTRMATQVTDVLQPQFLSVKALQQIFIICDNVAAASLAQNRRCGRHDD
ncbi:unnamed protein product [Cercospora beticola]|nr:unnamed protein product [Cercospora beticola]